MGFERQRQVFIESLAVAGRGIRVPEARMEQVRGRDYMGRVGVAATVVIPEFELLLLPLFGLFLPVLVVAVLRFFEPLVLGGFGTGVGATTVVTPVASV